MAVLPFEPSTVQSIWIPSILHAFTKTTNKVDRAAMNTARNRYKEMMAEILARKKAEGKC